MDKIKQNIDLQEAIQRYNIEKSVVGTLAYNIDQNLQKGMSPDEAIENVLQKSKKANVGEVHTWNGKRYKKQSNGKWLEVSEHDRTHSFLMETSAILKRKAQERRDFGIPYAAGEYEKDYIYWKEQASKLSDKEYEDHEIGLGGEKKEEGFKKGDTVKIPSNLTTDPNKRQGQSGKILNINEKEDEVTVEFSDGSIGRYQLDAVEKVTGGEKKSYSTKEFDTKKEAEKRMSLMNSNSEYSDLKINKTSNNKYTISFKKSQPESTLSKSEQTEAQKAKVKKVVEEFNKGILKSSAGELITDRSEALRFALSEAGIEIEKSGGEGSRGGKVIGHTKSGKPIYDTFEHEGHKSFDKYDHSDAVKLHMKLMSKNDNKRGYQDLNNKKDKTYINHEELAVKHSEAQRN
jgi:hypothetical protein